MWDKENPDALAPLEAYVQRYPDPELQPIVDGLRAKQQQNLTDVDREQGFKALKGGQVEAAAARFTEVLRRSPNDVNALVGLGYARLDEKRFSDALSLFDHARSLAPQRQDARDGYTSASFWLAMQRGAAAQQRKDPANAALAYQEALTLRPSDQGALLGLANAFMNQKKFADAEATFRQVLAQSPNNPEATAGMAFLRLNQGRFNEAASLFAKAHTLEPTRSDVSQGLQKAKFWGMMNGAAIALQQNRTKDALAAYEQALWLNPNDKDAMHGVANASMRAGDYSDAVKIYIRLTTAFPGDESNWLGLIQAQMEGGDPRAAIATTERIPTSVKQHLEQRSDYYSEMALIDYKMNRTGVGDQALQRALQLSRTSDTPDGLSARLQIAAAFMEQGKTLLAIEIYQQATQAHPEDPSGWEALVGAYTRMGHFSQAATAVRSMPQSAYQAAVRDAGFLNSVALIYSARGQCSEAEHILQRSISLDQATGRLPSVGTQLQLADVLMRSHRYETAEDVYYDIVGRDANSPDAWRGYLAVLHRRRADRTLVAELPRMPAAVRTQLEADPNFLILEASAYSSVGQNQNALPLLVKARTRFAAQHKQAPVDLDLQTAWTMLTVSPEEPGLSDLLQSTKARSGIDYKQRQAIQELWSLWSVRRAEGLARSKPQEALSILTEAAREYPLDRNIQVALASLYFKRDDKQEALDVFRTWGMAGAQAGDYRIAAGAALSVHKNQLAEQFLQRGLQRFPSDPELMHMKARQDIARGDYQQGERELRSALLALRDGAASGAQAKPLPSTNEQEATTLLADQGRPGAASDSNEYGPPCSPEPGSSTVGEASIRPMAMVLVVPHRQIRSQIRDTQNAGSQTPAPQPQQQQEAQQIQEESEAVSDRNTPLINTGGV